MFEMFVIQMHFNLNLIAIFLEVPRLQTNGASYEEKLKLKTSSSPLGTRLTPRTRRQMRKAKKATTIRFFSRSFSLSKSQIANFRGYMCLWPHISNWGACVTMNQMKEKTGYIINNDHTGSLKLAPAKQPLR